MTRLPGGDQRRGAHRRGRAGFAATIAARGPAWSIAASGAGLLGLLVVGALAWSSWEHGGRLELSVAVTAVAILALVGIFRRGEARERRRFGPDALAFAGFCVVAFLYFGIPIASAPGHMAIGSDTDPEIFIWSLAWWPHALLTGQNPIVSHAIWAPSGFDLAWATSIPGLAFLFSPLTLAVGPVLAYNTIAILLPALAAWSGYLLCRYLTRAMWPSLVGGYLFGFSSYVLGHEQGHMHLTAVFLVPLVVLAVLRFLDGEIGRRGLAVRLGVLLALQFSFSTEVFLTLTLAFALALVLAIVLMRAQRRRIGSLLAPVAGGYAIAALIASPLLYYALTGVVSAQFRPSDNFAVDLANLVVPTRISAIGGDALASISANFSGNDLEQTAYIGAPMLALLTLTFIQRRREPVFRFLGCALLVAIIGACGGELRVDGRPVVWLPWTLVRNLPLFNNVYPGRMMLYAILAAAVVVALWTASARGPAWLRVVVPLVIVVSLLPHLGQGYWSEKLDIPAFFTASDVERCIAPGENVLALPYGYTGSSVLWQAVSGFRYRLAGGEISEEIPRQFVTDTVGWLLADWETAAAVRAFAEQKGVTTIIVDPSDPAGWSTRLAPLGQPRSVGGVLLYAVGPGRTDSRACVAASSA